MRGIGLAEDQKANIDILAPAAQQAVARNVAVDAYRGFVMILMMAEVLQLARVAHAFPGNWFWAVLGYNQTHTEWAGCSLHDTDSALLLLSGGSRASLFDC